MPVENNGNIKGREYFTLLEALGLLFVVLSPWLESKESSERERNTKEKLKILALKSIHNAVNSSFPFPDYKTFSGKYGK